MNNRQEVAFERWKNTFLRLVLRDTKLSAETKKDVQAWYLDFFGHVGVSNNMIQAFSNFMWDMDTQIENGVNEELSVLEKMIPVIADPKDKNTLAILHALKEIKESWHTPLTDISDSEIDELVDDSEIDNSRPPGL